MKRSNGWESILESPQCREVLERVDALRKKGDIYPIQKDVFRAFKDCPFEKVRVVILGQDPYASKGQAIGRAFAVPKSTEVPRSLKNILTRCGATTRTGRIRNEPWSRGSGRECSC